MMFTRREFFLVYWVTERELCVIQMTSKIRYFVPTSFVLRPDEGLCTLGFNYFSYRNQHAIPLFTDNDVLPLQFFYCELTRTNLMFNIKYGNAPCCIQKIL